MMRHFLTRLDDINIKHLLSLPSLSLTEYEARALLTLVEGPKTSTEVGELATIPRTKTYEVLKNLMGKGFVEQADERPLKYRLALGSIERVASEVEHGYLTAKRFLEELIEIHRSGSLETFQSELERAMGKTGFRDIRKGPSFYSAALPRGYRVIVTNESMIKGLSLERILDLKKSEGTRYAIVLVDGIPEPDLKNRFEDSGVLLAQYRLSYIMDALMKKSEEIELFLGTHASFGEEFGTLNRDLDDLTSKCFSSLQSLKSKAKQTSFATPSNERLKELEDGLSRAKYDRMSLSSLWREVERSMDEHGRLGNPVIAELETVIEGLSSLKDRVINLSNGIDALAGELEKPVRILSYAPPEKPSEDDILDQEELKSALHGFVLSSSKRKLTIALLVGEHGIGKTLMIRYLAEKINSGFYGKNLAAITSSTPSFLEMYNSFVVGLANHIARMEVTWPPAIEKQRTFFGALRGFREMVRELVDKQGFQYCFWLIDDFDPTLQGGEAQALVIREMKSFLDSQSDLPLTVLMVMDEGSYKTLNNVHEDIASRISPANIFRMQELNRDGIRKFVEKSTGGFSPNTRLLEVLSSKSKGNPRRLIHILNEVLLNATAKRRKLDEDLFAKVAETMDFSEVINRSPG